MAAAPHSDCAAGDAFLGGRLRLLQPRGAQRAGSDAVLLAAAVPARPGERVFELGTGSGAATLCLLARVPGAKAVAVELQPDAALAAAANAARNGMADRMRVICGDGTGAAFRRRIGHGGYDHALANPPFFRPAGRQPAAAEGREQARAEAGSGSLAEWVASLVHAVRPGGSVTVIHRAERLADLLAAFALVAAAGAPGGAGIAVAPLWPRQGLAAKRVLLRYVKQSRRDFRLGAGLALHDAAGAYLPEAEAVLRQGRAFPEAAF